ncbi:ABC transporter permease [Marinigracilibium pacificum]|uniref:FtsX-like permease family protein n=1 Tax=Marinigracilibium pacificum TaxID=2729599 RepID=A0A848IZZ7_9BACT|nr:ABC transporter permease [Marinigracilibium pacificum]NMM50113.1 FtsX-like permease family protein [Marinigracilibium pacificum]
MWINYLKIAFRNLLAKKQYTIINLVGLSAGLGVAILILFFIVQEHNYDKFNKNYDRIAKVMLHEVIDNNEDYGTSTPPVLMPTIKEEFPQVIASSRFINTMNMTRIAGGKSINQLTHLVSTDFFKIFDFEFIVGNPESALSSYSNIILTETTAKKYFGNTNIIGRPIEMQIGPEYEEYVVSAVVKDPDSNSSIQFEALLHDEQFKQVFGKDGLEGWFNVFGETFILLEEGTVMSEFEALLPKMIKKALGKDYEEGTYWLTLLPLADIHINGTDPSGMSVTTDPKLLKILGGIAILVLIIACINFTTMAIGRSITRAKEVGVRKTMGARYKQLFIQFMVEALLITVFSAIIGIIIAQLILPIFNDLFDKNVELAFEAKYIALLIVLVLIIAFAAGVYPAVFLSSLKPVTVLKSHLTLSFGKQNLRKGLLAFQFFVSIFLITCTLIMYMQIDKIRNFDLGFNKDQIIEINVIPTPSSDLGPLVVNGFNKTVPFVNELKQKAFVENCGVTLATYGNNVWWQAGFPLEDGSLFKFRMNIVSPGYAETLGLEFVEGRNFIDNASDSSGIIINQKMAELLNLNDPINSQLPSTDNFDPHQIIGVVKNFHHAALYEEIEPLILAVDPELVFSGLTHLNIPGGMNPVVLVKVNSDNFRSHIAQIESDFNKLYPGEPFSFKFLDETIQRQYEEDEKLSKMVTAGALISIIIAAMGLYALVSLAINSRTKEIGIRKVMGAGAMSLSGMFNSEFLKVTIIGILIALPVSLFFMQSWLSSFIYHEVNWVWIMALAAFIGIVFTMIIVTINTLKAVWLNPVDTLKDE